MEAAQTVDTSPKPRPKEPLRLATPKPGWWSLNRLLVTAYKAVGFGVLTLILVGLVSYFGVNLFYLVDRHWILPAIVSPTDDRVLQLSEQLAEQEALRQKLLVERFDLKAKLEDATRTIDVEKRFQSRFDSAIQGDVRERRAELKRLRELFTDYANTKQEIQRSSEAYAGLSRQRSDEMMKAHLLELDNYLTTNYQLSQIAHSNLSLAESEVALFSKADELEHEIEAMEGANRRGTTRSLSYDSLRMEQEFYHSMLEEAKAEDQANAVGQSLLAIDESLARYERMLAEIRGSPYLKAAESHLSVAFMPYENQAGVDPGAPLFACRFGLLGCSRAGTVGEPLDGEVTVKHPLRNQLLRGLMVQLDLKDSAWAREQVLFTRRPPLFFF